MNERTGNNPGKLNHRITFLDSPGGDDGNAWPTADWVEHKTVWAELKTLKGNRVIEAAAIQMQDVMMFGCRYRSDVDDNMRIRYKGLDYQIDSLTNDDGNNQWLTLLVREVL